MDNLQQEATQDPLVRLPSYMPSDAVIVTDYRTTLEALRSPKMRPEPPTKNEEVSGGTLTTVYGRDHIRRRRIMNRLVRPNALDHYRDELLIPRVTEALRRLRDAPEADGTYRAELVEFTRQPFTEFSAALAGFDLRDQARVRELLELINAMGDQHRVKFFIGDQRPFIERGLAAKDRFEEDFFDPAMASCPYRPGNEIPEDLHELLPLLSAQVDPMWSDRDLCVRETFTSIFAAGVGTSSTMMTNTIDELSSWLPEHPEAEGWLGDMDFIARALQETLRLHPIFPAFGRVALEDTVLSTGQEVKAGQWVAGFATTANRDKSVFGEDADRFNPNRELPQGTARYGVGFGAGSHQCLGLRVVLGNDGVGSHAHVLRLLLAAGVRRDHEREAVKEPSERNTWMRYPAVFTTLDRALV